MLGLVLQELLKLHSNVQTYFAIHKRNKWRSSNDDVNSYLRPLGTNSVNGWPLYVNCSEGYLKRLPLMAFNNFSLLFKDVNHNIRLGRANVISPSTFCIFICTKYIFRDLFIIFYYILNLKLTKKAVIKNIFNCLQYAFYIFFFFLDIDHNIR